MGVNCVRADGPKKPKHIFAEESKIANDEEALKKEKQVTPTPNSQPVMTQNSQATPTPIPPATPSPVPQASITPDSQITPDSKGTSTPEKQVCHTTNIQTMPQTPEDDGEIRECKGKREIVEIQEENILDKEKEEKKKKLEEIEQEFKEKIVLFQDIKKKNDEEKKTLEDIEKKRLEEIEKKKQDELEKQRLEEIERNKIPLYEQNCTKIEKMLILPQIQIIKFEDAINAITFTNGGFGKSQIEELFKQLIEPGQIFTKEIKNMINDLFEDILSMEEIDPVPFLLTSSLTFCKGSSLEKKEVLFRNLESHQRNYVDVKSINDTILIMLSTCVNKIVGITIGNTTVNDENLIKLNGNPELIEEYSKRYYADDAKTMLHRHEFENWFASLNPEEFFSSAYHRAAFLKLLNERQKVHMVETTSEIIRPGISKSTSVVLPQTFTESNSIYVEKAHQSFVESKSINAPHETVSGSPKKPIEPNSIKVPNEAVSGSPKKPVESDSFYVPHETVPGSKQNPVESDSFYAPHETVKTNPAIIKPNKPSNI